MKKCLIIGAGVSGISIARKLAENGYKVNILEQRNHIAGNAYDYFENGILIHKYGPHLFHTNDDSVMNFLKNFSLFIPYEHRVLGEINNNLVPIPFNYKSMDILFDTDTCKKYKEIIENEYPNEKVISIYKLLENPRLKQLGNFIFDNVFKGYSSKQWGVEPSEFSQAVLSRVPLRLSYDDRYFSDKYQCVPEYGYTKLFENMLNHPNISISLNCNAFDYLSFDNENIFYDGEIFDGPVIYTGSIDTLFKYKYGNLPYRSLHFRLESHSVDYYQPAVQVNYPNRYSYTRISEFKRLQKSAPMDKTVIMYEYPCECTAKDIPYYPIENEVNNNIYQQYYKEASSYKNLFLLGRLAQYKYLNMDISIHNALELAEKIININNQEV